MLYMIYHKNEFSNSTMSNNLKNPILELGYASGAFIEKEDDYIVFYKTDY